MSPRFAQAKLDFFLIIPYYAEIPIYAIASVQGELANLHLEVFH